MAERTKATVLKTVGRASVSWVRIPLLPPNMAPDQRDPISLRDAGTTDAFVRVRPCCRAHPPVDQLGLSIGLAATRECRPPRGRERLRSVVHFEHVGPTVCVWTRFGEAPGAWVRAYSSSYKGLLPEERVRLGAFVLALALLFAGFFYSALVSAATGSCGGPSYRASPWARGWCGRASDGARARAAMADAREATGPDALGPKA